MATAAINSPAHTIEIFASAYDEAARADVAALESRTITGAGLATGGGDLTANRVISVAKASGAAANAGTDDASAVTPLALATPLNAIRSDVALRALRASPALTGVPTAPQAALGTATAQIATTGFVAAALEDALDNSSLADHLADTNNPHAVNASDVGLDLVDNTADLAKPISDATQIALNLKANILSPALSGVPTAPTAAPLTATNQVATTGFTSAAVAVVNTALTAKAPLASPALTGVPTAPQAVPGTATAQIATTNFVAAALTAKAPLASPALTGVPTAPQAVLGTATGQIATTGFVAAALTAKAPLASPALTGVPTAPQAVLGTVTGQIATTNFVAAALNEAFADLEPPPRPVAVRDTPPPDPATGDLWFDTTTANMVYVWVDDGSSSQWVPVANVPGAAGPAGGTGATGPQGPVGPVGPAANLSGMTAGRIPIAATATSVTSSAHLSGDVTSSTGLVTTLATVNSNIGVFQGLTLDGKGRVTAATNQNYLSGTVPIASGGTGATSLPRSAGPSGFPIVAGNLLVSDGTVVSTIGDADSAIGVQTSGRGLYFVDSDAAAGASSSIYMLRTRGTFAAPTAVESGDRLGQFVFNGWGSTGINISARAYQFVTAAENWTDTAQGTRYEWYATPNGGTATAVAMTLSGTAGLSVAQKLTTAASTATRAGLTLPHGVVPTTPTNGDLWSTTTGFYGQVNGATVGPFLSGTVPIANGGTGATSLPRTAGPSGYAPIINNLLVSDGAAVSTVGDADSAIGVGVTGASLHLTNSDPVAGNSASINMLRSRGDFAVPTAVQSNDRLGILAFSGWGPTGVNIIARAYMIALANENWTDTAQGTRYEWSTTPNGGTATAVAMTLSGTAGLSVAQKLTTAASTATRAGLTLPHGVDPTTPSNGDLWSTTAGFYGRVNGATVGPLLGGTVPIAKGGTGAISLPRTAGPSGYPVLSSNLLASDGAVVSAVGVADAAIGVTTSARSLQILAADPVGAGSPSLYMLRSRGTFAVPGAVQWSDRLGLFVFNGWGATGVSAAPRATWTVSAAEAWTDTAQGTSMAWAVTTVGGTTTATMTLANTGDLTITGGVATKAGGGAWVAPSDARLKRDIQDYSTGLAAVLALRPISYAYNGLGGTRDDGVRYVGLDAGETEAVMPELVGRMQVKLYPTPDDELPGGDATAGDDGAVPTPEVPDTDVKTVDPSALLYALLNAVKEMAARIEALEGHSTDTSAHDHT